MSTGQNFLSDSRKVFSSYKALAEKAISQLADNEINQSRGECSNSIALIVKHLRGNMLSRWTDFLTTDGEKPDRNRDTEFEGLIADSKQMLALWEEGWACVFATFDSLTEEDLSKTIFIRREPLTVMEAILRQIAHYSYHVGQIVYMAKEIRSGSWTSLSIPKGKSEEYK